MSRSSEDIHELVTQQTNEARTSSFSNWGDEANGSAPSTTTNDQLASTIEHALFSSESNVDQNNGTRQSAVPVPQLVDTTPATLDADGQKIQRPEKDSDDTTAPLERRRKATLRTSSKSPITTLNQMFAGPSSRLSSFTQASAGPGVAYTRSLSTDTTPLPSHLYQRGLIEGRHSDINLIVFGKTYALHRLILDRAPFFASALSEPWYEASQKTITLHPDDIDHNITQTSFELALKRLYGCADPQEESVHALALLATGRWLEMEDLVSYSITYILRRMDTHNLAPMIELVTSNYYGKAGEKVLSSAKARLCRDGWTMPVECWDAIPSEVIRELVGGDGFYIDSEFDRFVLASNILDRKLESLAVETGLVDIHSLNIPLATRSLAPRPQGGAELRAATPNDDGIEPSFEDWLALYNQPEIKPLLALIDEGIHYVHMSFEQLQHIRASRDIFGFPLVPEHVVSQALWNGVELRQRIVNATEGDGSLGLVRNALAEAQAEMAGNVSSDLLLGLPLRRFWVPSADCNIVIGGNGEPVVTTSAASTQWRTSNAALVHKPTDTHWFTDFMEERSVASPQNGGDSRPTSYSSFPPFRFGAEFPNPRTLPAGKRVYSRTVVYAGSLWNVYIQRVKASSRNPQLGIYLHRAKERESDDIQRAQTPPTTTASVDERIGALEREMLLRSEERIRRQRGYRTSLTMNTIIVNDQGNSSESSGAEHDDPEPNAYATAGGAPSAKPRLSTALRQSRKSVRHLVPDAQGDVEVFDSANVSSAGQQPSGSLRTSKLDQQNRTWSPALPSYVDTRPTIKTYFKIYTPSKGGRMLSVYESAPDDFKFSQSWGWKSSTLLMDDEQAEVYTVHELEDEVLENSAEDKPLPKGDGKLRCMVVLGIV